MFRFLVLVFLVLLVCSEVQGQIFFQEGDFPSDGNVTHIRVVKNGGNAGPIQVTIIPMTVGEYMQSGGEGCNLPLSFDPAESGDFDDTPIQATFLPSSQSETLTFNVPLPQDVVVEATEIFVVVMNVTGGEGFTITRGCTIVRITEFFTGEFFQWSREGQVINTAISLNFSETDGRQLLVTADRLVPAEIVTEITASVIQGASTDFILNRTYIIPPDRSSVDIELDIIDDNKAERDETVTFDLVARASGKLAPVHLSVTLTILDDEVVNYVFVNTPPVINVTEGEAATVFTMLTPMLDVTARPDLPLLLSENGSASEGIDFVRVFEIYPLLPVPLPTPITTILRPGIQPTRSFMVRLLPSNPTMVHRLTNITGTVTINILDDPSRSTVIQWRRNGDPVNSSLSLDLQESSGSQVLLTVDRTAPLSQPITITATVSGTATENSDFILNRTYVLPPDRSSVDVLLDIIDDDLAELDETITISLRAEVPGVTLTDREKTLEVVVNLRDNEVLNVVFLNTRPVVNVTEGDSVTLEAGLFPILSSTRGSIVARIQTASGSALEGTDFTEVNSSFTISSTPFSQVIMTAARIGFQPTSSFTVQLLPDNSMGPLHRLLNINDTITINILNDPNIDNVIQWRREGRPVNSPLFLDLQESSGSQVLLTVDRTVSLSQPITITATVSGTATENSDFILNRTYVLPPDRSSVDVLLDIIDDDLAELDETITISLRAEVPGITLTDRERTLEVVVNLLDNEVLNVVFLNTTSVVEVTEGDSVTLVAGLSPILSSSRGSIMARIQTASGSALEGTDFTEVNSLFTISSTPFSQVFMTAARIGSQPTRSFTVRLLPDNSMGPLHRLLNINDTITINILNDPNNDNVIQWRRKGRPVNSPLSLDLQESSGSQVLLTVDRTASLSQPITITATVSGTATESSDFILNKTYVLPPDRSSVDVLLDIIDDDLAELDETITISLRAEIPGVTLIDRERTLEVVVNLQDNEVLNYVFLNALPVLNITEGESVTLTTGLNPSILIENRGPLVARIHSRSGTAREGRDFIKVDSKINVRSTTSSQTITTISRPGIQPSRNFTLHLSPDSTSISHHLTDISGSIVINILDNSMQPLAPSVSKFRLDKDNQLVVEWDHESSGSRPLDHFTVIVKSCDKRPCLIDTDNPQSDEKETMSPKDRREFFYKPDLKYMVFSVLVCAVNSLGRNCTAYDPVINTVSVTPGLVADPNDPFLIWLVIICVLLVLLCCCCIPIIILIFCCCYKRDKERAYYPKRNMGRMLKGASPGSSDSNSIDIYMDEMKYSDMKYL